MSADPVRQESYWDLNGDLKWPIETWLKPLHAKGVRKQRSLLKEFGFRQSFLKHPLLPSVTVWMLALALLSGLLWNYSDQRDKPADLATIIAGMLVFVFGYYQWRSSRYEKSMEDFYSRLKLANEKREAAELVSKILGHPWDLKNLDECSECLEGYQEHQWSMYVYSELDNLEYVVEKYRLGYMQPRHAIRELRTFYQRCVRPSFRNRALQCARCMAYNEGTIRVVKRVCEHIEDRRKRPRRLRKLPPPVNEDRRKAPRRWQDLRFSRRWRKLTDKAAL